MANVVRSVDIEKPVHEVYDRWTLLEDLPSLMGSVQSVRQLDDRTTHWIVRIAREAREFAAVTTEQVPDIRIAWRSRGTPAHAGVVSFHRLAPTRTRVTVQLDWEPGGLFDRIGHRTGLVGRAIAGDLESFARAVETSVPTRPGWRGEIRPDDDAGTTGIGTTSAPGRDADSPTEIPAKGWLQVLRRTVKQLKDDDIPVVAAGVAFFSFLALIPALGAIVSVYGMVADPGDVGRQLDSFFGALPRDAAELLREQVTDITRQSSGGLGVAATLGVLASLWSASKGAQALISALNIAYDEEETRKGWKVKLLSVAMTIAGALGATALIATLVVMGDNPVAAVLRWPLLAVAVIFGLTVVYRYAPDRDTPRWRWVTPGALLTAVLLAAGSFGFSIYVNDFGSYSETYGTLGAIVVLLLWLYLAAYVTVLGVELDAELERQTAKDSTEGRAAPLGKRGAFAADTVAN